MKQINQLDEAQLRFEFRTMYNNVGYVGSILCLYELIKSAEILSEVLVEEQKRLKNEYLGDAGLDNDTP